MQMREIIRLVEETGQTFFHGSKKKFKPGTVLRAQKRGYAHATGLTGLERRATLLCEQRLEHYRTRYAPTAPSRTAAVYLVTDPSEIEAAGGYADNVYEVAPDGEVCRCNLYWYSVLEGVCLQVGEDIDEYDVQEAARGYWKALPNDMDEPHRDLFEYLTSSVRVMRVMGQA